MLDCEAESVGPMARPFTRQQALQNRAFLKALTCTGNARGAARELGFNRSPSLNAAYNVSPVTSGRSEDRPLR
jgi:hypothetical protein